MASRRRRYSPWQTAQPFLVVAGIVLLAAIYFGFPGAGIYLFACVLTKAWPAEREFEPETPKAEKARNSKVYAHHLLSPFGTGPFAAKLLAGPPGQHSGQAGAYLPATRVSTWAALPVVWLTLGLFAAVPTAIPMLDALLVFLLWQACAAAAREVGHPAEGEAFPAAMADREALERTNTTVLVASFVVGAIVGGAAGWFAADRLDALVTASDWPTWMKAATAILLGLTAGIAAAARPYIDAYLEPIRDHLARSEAWQMRWLSVPRLGVAAPFFASEHRLPPEGQQLRDGSPAEETHRVAYFQTPPGATIENYRAKTTELTSAIATSPGEAEYVLVSTVNKTDDAGQPIPGTRLESTFGVYWNTVPLPDRAHLVVGLDNWTTKFVIQRAFDRAFVALKLGMPDLVRVLPLHDMSTSQALWETIWALPPETTFDKVASKERDVAEKIGADFLSVGRHVRDSSGGRIHESHVSVVFGTHPDHVELVDPSLRPWLDSLSLESAFHNLKLGNPLLEDTEQLSMPGYPDLMEARFRLDDTVAWGNVIRKTDALAEKLNVEYLRFTRRLTGNRSSPLVSVVYGAHPNNTALIGDPPDYDPDEIHEGEETSQLRLFLDGIDWEQWFRSCKLVGTDGSSPKPVSKYTNSQGVSTYRMTSVPGLSTEDIREKHDAIMNTSGLGYLEVENDPDAAYFRLLAAKIDPLDKPYLAVEYAPEAKPTNDMPVLHPPVPGTPDIDWVVGPGADGHLLVDKWAGDNPHLFVGGACLTPETLVRVDEASEPVPLGDLARPGHERRLHVRTGLPDGTIGWAGSTHAGTVRTDDAYRLTLDDGYELEGSADHPIWTFHGWRGLATLRHGDLVATEQPGETHAVWRRVREVRHVGVRELYDLTVSSTHNYVANGVVAHNSGSGKALALDTLVPTPTGWAKLGDLSVGDQVLDENGRPCAVTWLSPVWVDRPVYEVEFDDGQVIVADAAHEWEASDIAARSAASSAARSSRVGEQPGWGEAGAAMLRAKKDGSGRRVTLKELSNELGGYDTPLRAAVAAAGLPRQPEAREVAYRDTTRTRTVQSYDRDACLEVLAARVEDAVNTYARRRNSKHGPRLVTTEEMAAAVRDRHGKAVWSIDVAAALDLPHADLPLDPYLLGLLLGDGGVSLTDRQTFTSDDPELVQAVRDALPAGMDLVSREPQQYGIVWPGRQAGDNAATRWLASIGLTDGLDTLKEDGHDRDSVLAGALAASPRGRGGIVTTSEVAADTLQAMATGAGYRATRSTYTGQGGRPRYLIALDRTPAKTDLRSFLAGAALVGISRSSNGAWTVAARTTRIIEPHLPDDVRVSRQRAGYDTGILTCEHPKPPSPLRQQLETLGVHGCVSGTKFVPDRYLRASAEQRLALLQGLMDTDGTISADGHAEFTSTSQRLAADVLELARSLGIKASIAEGRATIDGRDCGPKWRVTWTSTVPAFRLPRKAERVKDATDPRVRRRYVVDVRRVASVPVRCVEVDSPSHLFLAGESMVPTSNSVAILWMILQMMHNNDPADVKFALADPKTELGYFADAAHTNFFLGLSTPGFGENPRRALADLLGHMRDETYRRNTLMANHPRMPQNLNQSRFIAAQEIAHARAGTVPEGWPTGLGFPWWDGKPEEHPFMLPFQFIVIEECSSFFATPAKKDHRPDWEEVVGHVEELARISRSAGIHLVAATQYPKRENIPTTLLAQCRRIGLPMNMVGSMLTIEQPDLAKLSTPGRGMMSQGKGYRGVRCLFVRVPDDKNPDMPDDRASIYSNVVRKEGARSLAVDAEVPPDLVVSHGPTFVSAPPPAPDGLWVPRSPQHAAPAPVAPAGSDDDTLDLLAELEQAALEPDIEEAETAADAAVPVGAVAVDDSTDVDLDPDDDVMPAPQPAPRTPPDDDAIAAPSPPAWALQSAGGPAEAPENGSVASSSGKTTERGYSPISNTQREATDRNEQDNPVTASPTTDEPDLDDLLADLD